MPTRSSTWIHGMYCRPPATGPPTPRGPPLVEELVPARAVEADRRGAHEGARPRVGRGEAQDEVAGPGLARPGDRAPRLVAPALVDALAREMDDGVAAGERGGGG